MVQVKLEGVISSIKGDKEREREIAVHTRPLPSTTLTPLSATPGVRRTFAVLLRSTTT